MSRYGWFHSKQGPRKGALIQGDGTVVPLDYTNYADMLHVRDTPNVVGVANLVPKTGRWNAEAKHPTHGGTVWSTDHTTAEDAAIALLAKVAAASAHEAAIRLDPPAHLKRELERHDWWHFNSDSFGVCQAGEAHMREIQAIAAKCAPDVAKRLWDAHAPPEFR